MGFAKQPDGPFEWFLLKDLPTNDELKQKGYSGSCYTRLCECDLAEVTLLLEQKGINLAITESFASPSGGMLVEQIFRPALVHRRGLAKIALNYLTHQHGAAVALEPRFDPIRSLVMEGVEPAYEYYAVDQHPIIEGDKQNGRRLFGHALLVQQRDQGVEAVVSLYNRFRHGFLLARDSVTPIEPRGHFFDIGNRVIHRLSPG